MILHKHTENTPSNGYLRSREIKVDDQNGNITLFTHTHSACCANVITLHETELRILYEHLKVRFES